MEEYNMQEEDKKKKKKRMLMEIVDTAIYILIVIVITYLMVNYVVQKTEVSGTSMYDTLDDEDSLLIDKISYRIGDPKRFDIIVFKYLHQDDTYYIKRIIGLPGETVQILDGKVYIDGELLESDVYGMETILDPGRAANPIELGEDEYFVMGDNRNHSTDGRKELVGNVKRDQIVGKAFVRIWPLQRISILKHQ